MERVEEGELFTLGKSLPMDRVILNSVWWSAASLFRICADWSVRAIDSPLDPSESGKIWKNSHREISGVRRLLNW